MKTRSVVIGLFRALVAVAIGVTSSAIGAAPAGAQTAYPVIVEGTVTSSRGGPVVGASVTIDWGTTYVSTDENGQFHIETETWGSVVVEVTDVTGAHPISYEVIETVPAPAITTVNMQLTARAQISGTVRSSGGALLPEEGIHFYPLPDFGWPPVVGSLAFALSGVDGTYVAYLDPGNYEVGFESIDGFAQVATMTVGTDDQVLDLVKPEYGVLSGRITRLGQPLGGLTVSARPVSEAWGSSGTVVQPDGAYALRLREGDYDVEFTDGALTLNRRLTVTATGAVLDIDLLAAPVITGRIVDPAGNPVAGAKVYASGSGLATSGADGTYSITLRRDGTFVLWVDAPANYVSNETRTITLMDGESAIEDFILQVIPRSITGRLVDADGNPTFGYARLIDAVTGETIDSGYAWNGLVQFSVHGVIGAFVVVAEVNGTTRYAPGVRDRASATVFHPTPNMSIGDITVGVGGTAQVTVTGPTGPIANAVVSLDDGHGNRYAAETGANGVATIPAIRLGSYRMTASAERYRHAVLATRLVVEEDVLASASIELIPATQIRGTVTYRGRAVAAEVTLWRYSADGFTQASAWVETDALGRYEFTTVEPGQYVVSASAPGLAVSFGGAAGGPRADQVIDVDSTPVTVDHAVVQWASISVPVADPDGGPTVAADVSLTSATPHLPGFEAVLGRYGLGQHTIAGPSDDGIYRFPLVLPGSYRIFVNPWNGALLPEYYSNAYTEATSRVIVARPGQAAQPKVRLAQRPSMSGTVRNSMGFPVTQAPVRLIGADGAVVQETTTGFDGYYEFTLLDLGDYRVEVAATAGFATTWYGNTTDVESARTVRLTAGLNLRNAIVVMAPAVAPTPKPAAPAITNLYLTGYGTEMIIEWADRSDNEYGFYVERRAVGASGSGNYQRIAKLGPDVTQWWPVGSAGTWDYRVVAVNPRGQSPSAAVRITI